MLFVSTAPFVDTIVAPITGSGPAAVAVIRLSGSDAFEISSRIFQPWPEAVTPKYALVGTYKFGEKGIALPFMDGASFTGEESVELSIHGGRASITALLDACVENGARLAKPGEFTLRAFLNGKMDLSQAEAIADVVEAETSRQLRLASLNMRGDLKYSIEGIRDSILGEIAALEASVDFSEEIGEFDFKAAQGHYRQIYEQVFELLSRGRRAHLSRIGIRVAIVGRPNVGKSSLFNRLLGNSRAIVTSIAGTTRDTIEEGLDWNGLRVVLVDTAGIREVEEQIERLGIERTFQTSEAADHVFYVYDAGEGFNDEDAEIIQRFKRTPTIVGNKADLLPATVGISVSALTGEGMEKLSQDLALVYGAQETFTPVNERQQALLQHALNSLAEAESAAKNNLPPDLISVLLNEARAALGQIVGTEVSADMLSEIFGRFCIGK